MTIEENEIHQFRVAANEKIATEPEQNTKKFHLSRHKFDITSFVAKQMASQDFYLVKRFCVDK